MCSSSVGVAAVPLVLCTEILLECAFWIQVDRHTCPQQRLPIRSIINSTAAGPTRYLLCPCELYTEVTLKLDVLGQRPLSLLWLHEASLDLA